VTVVFEEIQSIIQKFIGKKEITPDTDFIKDLKLNSYDIINIVTEFERRYKLVIPTKELRKFNKVRDVIEYASLKGLK